MKKTKCKNYMDKDKKNKMEYKKGKVSKEKGKKSELKDEKGKDKHKDKAKTSRCSRQSPTHAKHAGRTRTTHGSTSAKAAAPKHASSAKHIGNAPGVEQTCAKSATPDMLTMDAKQYEQYTRTTSKQPLAQQEHQ